MTDRAAGTTRPSSLFTDAALLARRFHELYEELAPSFGYETRQESAVPWEQVPQTNRQLMIAVCAVLIEDLPPVIKRCDPECWQSGNCSGACERV